MYRYDILSPFEIMLLLNLHFYKPPLMLREDISWTVSVEKGKNITGLGKRRGVNVGPLGQTVAGRTGVQGSANIGFEGWNPITSTRQETIALFYW